jgi:hypothetical protein
MTTVNVQRDDQKTDGQPNSLPRMCQLQHILVQDSADIQ